MSIGVISDRAGTHHGPEWYGIQDRALGIIGAGSDGRAGLHALVLNADELAWTLGILIALANVSSVLAE